MEECDIISCPKQAKSAKLCPVCRTCTHAECSGWCEQDLKGSFENKEGSVRQERSEIHVERDAFSTRLTAPPAPDHHLHGRTRDAWKWDSGVGVEGPVFPPNAQILLTMPHAVRGFVISRYSVPPLSYILSARNPRTSSLP